ncbi:ISXO2-like transposase domain-containing protein [Ditylenchus destructor]|nr:ISXO2-like transposase domain-containing protein [Ditylenchus destructor]
MNVPAKPLQSQNDPGTFTNGAPKLVTSKTETSVVELDVVELDDEPDPATIKWKLQIDDPNNPYYFQRNLCQQKLQKLRETKFEEMDGDSLNAFLNIVRIESGKPVIVVSSYYASAKPKEGRTLRKITYHGKLENFEVAVMPIFIDLFPYGADTGAGASGPDSAPLPVTSPGSAPDSASAAYHWVLGIYKRSESIIYYYDSHGMKVTYGTGREMNTALKKEYEWVSKRLKYIVRYFIQGDAGNGSELEIKAVPLDSQLHNSDTHSPMRKINEQHDYVNCGFHVALIAESFLMNNEEVFLEKLDIAAERKRIVDILFGLLKFRYIPREILHTPNDGDLGQKMQQLNMNASSPTSKTIKNTTTEMSKDKSKEYLWKHIPEVNAQPNSNVYDKNHAENARVPQKPNDMHFVSRKEEYLSKIVEISLLFQPENKNKIKMAEFLKKLTVMISKALGNFAVSDEDIADFIKRNAIDECKIPICTLNSGRTEYRELKNENNAASPTTILIPKEERQIPTKNFNKEEMPTVETDTTEGFRMDTISNERNSISRLQEANSKNFRSRSSSREIGQEIPQKKFRQEVQPNNFLQEVQPNSGQEVEKAEVNRLVTANGKQQNLYSGNPEKPNTRSGAHSKINIQENMLKIADDPQKVPSKAKFMKDATDKQNRRPKTFSQQITYDLETNNPEITDKAVINYLQAKNILQKEVVCQKCKKGRKLYPCNDKWKWYCTTPKCENPVGLGVNNWIFNRKLTLPEILRFLYCWSRQMKHKEIVEKVGCVRSTCGLVADSVREACGWYVYDRNSNKIIGGKGMIVEVDVKEFGEKKQLVLGAVCRQTKEKWMVVVPNSDSDTLAPIIKKKVHQESIIVTGQLLNDIRLKPHFKDHFPIRRKDNIANSDDPIDVHTQTIESAWDSLEAARKARQGTPQMQWPSYVAEWLWRDEISRKEGADTFEEILKTIAEFWPAGEKTHMPIVEYVHRSNAKASKDDESGAETDEKMDESDGN